MVTSKFYDGIERSRARGRLRDARAAAAREALHNLRDLHSALPEEVRANTGRALVRLMIVDYWRLDRPKWAPDLRTAMALREAVLRSGGTSAPQMDFVALRLKGDHHRGVEARGVQSWAERRLGPWRGGDVRDADVLLGYARRGERLERVTPWDTSLSVQRWLRPYLDADGIDYLLEDGGVQLCLMLSIALRLGLSAHDEDVALLGELEMHVSPSLVCRAVEAEDPCHGLIYGCSVFQLLRQVQPFEYCREDLTHASARRLEREARAHADEIDDRLISLAGAVLDELRRHLGQSGEPVRESARFAAGGARSVANGDAPYDGTPGVGCGAVGRFSGALVRAGQCPVKVESLANEDEEAARQRGDLPPTVDGSGGRKRRRYPTGVRYAYMLAYVKEGMGNLKAFASRQGVPYSTISGWSETKEIRAIADADEALSRAEAWARRSSGQCNIEDPVTVFGSDSDPYPD